MMGFAKAQPSLQATSYNCGMCNGATGASLLEIAKAFAGPSAILVASGVAAWITYKLGSRQAETADAQRAIAEAQRDIAYDKLKHDLFDKRYEVYRAAENLIKAVIGVPPGKSATLAADPEIKRLRYKIGEAGFFFPADTRAFCENIENQVIKSITASYAITGYDDDRPEREQLNKQRSDADIELARMYERLAAQFARDLSFNQLTKARSP